MPDPITTKKTEIDAAIITSNSNGIIKIMFKKHTEVNALIFRTLFGTFNQMEKGRAFAFIYYAEDCSVTVTEDGRRFVKTENIRCLKYVTRRL